MNKHKVMIGIEVFLLCMIVTILGGNAASSNPPSNGVSYNKNGQKTVQDALDNLYSNYNDKIKYGNASASQILSGKTALVNGNKVTGTMADRGTAQYGEGWGWVGSGDNEYFAINRLPEGYYHAEGNWWAPEARIKASTVRNELGITADKIVKGQTIAGVAGTAETGTNTSDANANENQILSGKTAYVKGYKITGRMRNASVKQGSEAGLNSNYPGLPVLYGTSAQLNTATDGTKIFSISPATGYYPGSGSSYVSMKQSDVASAIGLTADKLKKGENVLGITGTGETGYKVYSFDKVKASVDSDQTFDGMWRIFGRRTPSKEGISDFLIDLPFSAGNVEVIDYNVTLTTSCSYCFRVTRGDGYWYFNSFNLSKSSNDNVIDTSETSTTTNSYHYEADLVDNKLRFRFYSNCYTNNCSVNSVYSTKGISFYLSGSIVYKEK